MRVGIRMSMWRAGWMVGLGVMVFLASGGILEARVFTDEAGRTVDAELVGVRGENVVLSRQGVAGQWPLGKLSKKDQAYVREWQTARSSVPKLSVRIFDRDGVGEKGTFPEDAKGNGAPAAAPSPVPGLPGLPPPPGGGAPPPNVPGIRETEQKARYKHYDVDITNPASVDANRLKVDYVLYVLQPDGSVGTSAAGQTLPALVAGQRATVKTEAIAYSRTKTTALNLRINTSRTGSPSVTAAQKTSRESERFGGAWVRVRGVDGALLGEARSLHPDLERLNPEWTGPKETEVEELPVLKSLDGLLELLKNLPKPPLPGAGSSETTEPSKGGPPLPPGFPPKQ